MVVADPGSLVQHFQKTPRRGVEAPAARLDPLGVHAPRWPIHRILHRPGNRKTIPLAAPLESAYSRGAIATFLPIIPWIATVAANVSKRRGGGASPRPIWPTEPRKTANKSAENRPPDIAASAKNAKQIARPNEKRLTQNPLVNSPLARLLRHLRHRSRAITRANLMKNLAVNGQAATSDLLRHLGHHCKPSVAPVAARLYVLS